VVLSKAETAGGNVLAASVGVGVQRKIVEVMELA